MGFCFFFSENWPQKTRWRLQNIKRLLFNSKSGESVLVFRLSLYKKFLGYVFGFVEKIKQFWKANICQPVDTNSLNG